VNSKVIRYRTEFRSDSRKYIFDFTFNTIGLVAEETSSDSADIYYGNQHKQSDCRFVIKEDKSDTIWEELIKGDATANGIGRVIPFDIVNAIGFFLNDDGNKDLPRQCYDEYGRLIFYRSYQYRCYIADLPIVNLYNRFP
jgi:hypothetical protein